MGWLYWKIAGWFGYERPKLSFAGIYGITTDGCYLVRGEDGVVRKSPPLCARHQPPHTTERGGRGMASDPNVQFTHNGWFMFCPVKVDMNDPELPIIDARHWVLEPLFVLSRWTQQSMIWLLSFMNPDYYPAWSLRITGER